MYACVATTWLYSTVIGCIPLSADDTYTYLGSTRLRICFIDFKATSGGSTFAALLLCAVVAPSLIAVSVCYCQIFITARLQAQRIYDIELAAVAASRRVSPSQAATQQTEGPPSTKFSLIRVAPFRENAYDESNGVIMEVEEGQTGQTTARESPDVATNVNGELGDLNDPTSGSTDRRSRTLWQSAINGVIAATSTATSSENSDTRWQRTMTKVTLHTSLTLLYYQICGNYIFYIYY